MSRRLWGAPSSGQGAAERAVQTEEKKLERVQDETGAILEAAGKLKALGQANDFASRIRHSLGG